MRPFDRTPRVRELRSWAPHVRELRSRELRPQVQELWPQVRDLWLLLRGAMWQLRGQAYLHPQNHMPTQMP